MANKKEEALDLAAIVAYAGRTLPKQYLNLVRSRWMRSYKTCNDYMKLVHSPGYYFAYSNYVSQVLNRDNTLVRLAVLDEDEDIVLGFSVCSGHILHYVHVPKLYRKQGIGTMLMPDEVEWTTHLTKIGMRIWASKYPNIRFNPFL